MAAPRIAIDPAHDAEALAPAYALKQRLQVRDFLVPASAESIHRALHATSWSLAFNQGKQTVQLDAEHLAQLTQVEAIQLNQMVLNGAVNGFQFCYGIYPLLAAYFEEGGLAHPLFPVFEWLNGPEVLDFARKLTGLDDIVWADAQATSYGPGHFLKYHTDETPSQQRLAAYVLNFTSDWGRDWGGQLQFFDDKYDVEQGLRPVYNALNIFTVPMDHSVSMVVPYAPRVRLSITGWLRGDRPPGRIGSQA